jgi:hypothetical protein
MLREVKLRGVAGSGGGIRLQLSEFVHGIDVGEGVNIVVKLHFDHIQAGVPLVDFALATLQKLS